MRNVLFVALLITALTACKKEDVGSNYGFESIEVSASDLNYPDVRKDNVSDNYFGTEIQDPFRWLEDDNSDETASWVQAQNKVTFSYLNDIDFRAELRERLEETYNYTKYSLPFKEGDNYFYRKNDGLQNQSVMYKTDNPEQDGEVFFDPNKLSDDGTVALGGTSVNKAGNLMAYSVSTAGSDWQELHVKDITTGKDLDDKIEWAKFTGMTWKDDGFFYGRYPEPKEGDELSSANLGMQLYYHKVGTDQSEDVIAYEDSNNPDKYFGSSITEDERFLQITGGFGTSGNDIRIKDLSKENSDFAMVKASTDTEGYMIGNRGDDIYLMTNDGAPNWRLVKLNLSDPTNWSTVIPESENLLESVSMAGGKLFARYQVDVTNRIYRYDEAGTSEGEVSLPGLGSVSGFGGSDDDTELFYQFTSFTSPGTIYSYDIASGESRVLKQADVDFSADDYETKQVFYPSKDGTKIPMFITHKKGLELDGSNPTMLYAYGGFDISIKPSYSATRQVWLENGGVYASANLRGGGEYGAKWHDGGRLLNKQNVFDDFIAAGEYLIEQGYTSSSKLAMRGGSNGGLLVGAVMTQRPELFKVALPAVGVMDMLRYEQFTIGYAWATDYGSMKEEKHFRNLLSYSPLHNMKSGTSYPATMVTTADHDDRVVPAHSFKFASRLQEAHEGDNPVLIRVEVDAGHGAGKPTSKILDEWADIYAFTMYNLGVKPRY